MRTVGLLGGMSWESSALYYRVLNETVRARVGGLHSAPCVLHSFDFAEVEALQAAGDWDGAGALLADAARGLVGAGAELLVVCTNTMHEVADAIEAAIAPVPLLHIADATAAAVHAAGCVRPGLLGTAFTMERPFYAGRMRDRHGLDVLVPDAADRADVHRVIYDELVRGVVTDASRERYLEVIAALRDRGADGIVLGCTEIELLVGPDDVDVPVFETARLHAEAAATSALA